MRAGDFVGTVRDLKRPSKPVKRINGYSGTLNDPTTAFTPPTKTIVDLVDTEEISKVLKKKYRKIINYKMTDSLEQAKKFDDSQKKKLAAENLKKSIQWKLKGFEIEAQKELEKKQKDLERSQKIEEERLKSLKVVPTASEKRAAILKALEKRL